MFAKINDKGFTLVELLVVVVIIAVLAAIAVPIFLNQKAKAQDSADQATVSALANAMNVARSTGGSADISGNPIVVTDGTGATMTVPLGGAAFSSGATIASYCVGLNSWHMSNGDTAPKAGACP